MTNLIPGAWRINIVSKGFLPEGCHGVVAKSDSNDLYIEEHLVDDFLANIRDARVDYEPADEEFDVTGCEFKMGDDSMKAAEEPTGIPAFGLTMDQVEESYREDVPMTITEAVQEVIEGLEEELMATDFQKDALLPTAQSVFHDSDGSGSIDWADGSYTEYDTEGQMIAKSHSMFMKPTIKDYIDKMFPQSKWKLGE